MKKIEIMPKVIVYQNMYEKINEVYEVCRDSETDSSHIEKAKTENSLTHDMHGIDPISYDFPHIIRKWVPWYEIGTRSSFTFSDGESLDTTYLKQAAVQKRVCDAIDKALKDYSDCWSNEDWPIYAKNWTYKGSKKLNSENRKEAIFGTLDILKHYYDVEQDFALPWHTDAHYHRIESPGMKSVVTVTVYLNDNYDGGEVQFLNEESNTLTTYKPKAGDITIFPSNNPYWHSAMPVKNHNKYLLRSFILVDYEGSEAWHNGLKTYGAEEWEKMEKERVIRESNDGKYGIHVTTNPSFNSDDVSEKVVFVPEDKNIYINGADYV